MTAADRLADLKKVGGFARGLPKWAYGAVVTAERRQVTAAVTALSMRIAAGGPEGDVDLRLAEHSVFSQNGEDGILAAILLALPDVPRHFVEFGTGDGGQCNTRFLAEVLGWSGTYFEPGGAARRLARRWQGTARIVVRPVAISPRTIAEQFDEAGVPHDLGVLSIDVDGQDYWMWEGLSERFRPAIVVIEYNALFPPGEAWTEALDQPLGPMASATSGASLAAIEQLGRAKGYRLVHTELCAVNAFLIREDLLEASGRRFLGITDRSPNYFLSGTGYDDLTDGPPPVRV